MYIRTSDRVANIIIAFVVLAIFTLMIYVTVMSHISVIIFVFIFLFPAIAAVGEIFDELVNTCRNYKRWRIIRKYRRKERE